MRNRMICCVLLLLLLPPSTAQQTGSAPAAPPPQEKPVSPSEAHATAGMAQASPHRKNLQRDSARLVEMATELKQAVDGSTENVLSLNAMRKAEAIEKLAHEMRGRVRGER